MNNKELMAFAEAWFTQQGWKAFAFQKQTWQHFLQGKNGLLNAPTGSGKTMALWIAVVLDFIKHHPTNYQDKHKGLLAVWITPLRALSQEIQQATERFITENNLSLTVGVRTGDTSAKERASQKRKMPNLLITTPESLQLLLASKNYDKTFQFASAIIIDEWHELLGTKRGVQIELALSRLKTVASKLKIWGISATIGNLDQATEVLLGTESAKNAAFVKANWSKKIEMQSVIPESMDTFPWRGHMGLHLLEEIIPIIRGSKTTLLFTNTRAQCEVWFQKILSEHPEFAGEIAMHHGSINKDTRLWVEQAIRNESLKAVVCTSSLDLGVDFAPVETIIQIGGPKGVARFLQRAGRSNHQPKQKSVIHFLPTHAMELFEASALKKAITKNAVEDRIPYLNAFDTLVQYLVTLAVSNGFYPGEIFKEIKNTFCFQAITEVQWEWCLQFIHQGGESLRNYDEYKKVEIEADGKYIVKSRGVAMRHRLQIGTIVSDAVLTVKYLKGGFIGTVEEWFVSKLKIGDVFTFAGRNLELYQIKNMQVIVKKSNQKKSIVPSWMGGRMTLSSQMSELLRDELYLASEFMENKKVAANAEYKALTPILQRQKLESTVPKPNEFLIETFKTREGYHHVFYPFEGKFVHEAMASLLAYRISLLHSISFTIAHNDYGFELLSDQYLNINDIIDNNLLTTTYVTSDLQKSLNATEMARRKFRDIAVIAGLVFTGYPNKQIKNKHLQSSSQLLFDVFKDMDPNNLLYQQAITETFDHQLEIGRLQKALERIETQEIVWKACQKPTPFSFPIITDRLREKLSSEKWSDRIKRMTALLEKR